MDPWLHQSLGFCQSDYPVAGQDMDCNSTIGIALLLRPVTFDFETFDFLPPALLTLLRGVASVHLRGP